MAAWFWISLRLPTVITMSCWRLTPETKANSRVAPRIEGPLVLFCRLVCRVVDDAGEEDLSVAFVANRYEERMVDDHVEGRRLDSHGKGADADAGGRGGLGAFFINAQERGVTDFADLQRLCRGDAL